MALNPSYLDSLPNTLVEMYSLVEIDILEDMARRISTYDFFIPAAMHQNQKLQELGMTQQHIIEALAGMTGQTQQEIVDLLTEAGEVAIEDDVEYYKAADVYKPDEINSEALHKQLNSGLLQTQQAFKNITATTANTATKQFENALDRAWTQINVGGMDYNTAIHRAIKDLSQQGVGAIAYKSGRVDSIEVAVRRAVVTGANQTAAKTQEALANELGVDLVEVSAHGGARPEHAKWQGKCYSRNGRKVIDGVVYEDFEKATRYGHGDGLGGWNCRHTFHPYIHGAPRTWSDKAIKDLDKKNITYNGEKYNEYEASQIQRGIERDIRSLKRQVAAIEAGGGDASAERAQLRKAQKGYTDFAEQTGLRKQTARTKISTGTGTERPAPDVPTTKQKNVTTPTNSTLTNNANNGIMINAPKSTETNLVINGKSKGEEMDVSVAASGANPNYQKDSLYRVNCQRCVQAYEFRRRGFDVEALPAQKRKDKIVWGNECFVDASGNIPQFEFYKTKSDVAEELKNAPVGARYIIYVQWKGRNASAHVFIAERERDKVRAIDPQSGDTSVLRYFKEGRAGKFGYLRIDDKELTTDIDVINATMR